MQTCIQYRDLAHPRHNISLEQRFQGQGTVQVLEFVKSCFDGEAIVIKEVVAGRLAGRKMCGG